MNDDMITICPIHNVKLKKQRHEVEKGIFADVMFCSECNDYYMTAKQHGEISTRYIIKNSKAFMSGNSLAIRIPKHVAEKVNLKKGSSFRVRVRNGKIIIEDIA
jgi:antitoxin MazE